MRRTSLWRRRAEEGTSVGIIGHKLMETVISHLMLFRCFFRKYTKNTQVKYQCDECKYQFSPQVDVKTHRLTKHEGVRLTCDQYVSTIL